MQARKSQSIFSVIPPQTDVDPASPLRELFRTSVESCTSKQAATNASVRAIKMDP